jgi:hypothetical protein
MQDTKKLTAADLRQFTGSEQWYRHALVRDVLFTDGAKYVADQAGAYWLLDEIALAQRYEKTVAGEAFQLWKLKVEPGHTATLTCEDGNMREALRFFGEGQGGILLLVEKTPPQPSPKTGRE